MSRLLEQDLEYHLHVYNRLNLEIVRGEGSYLYDREGKQYLDMFSGLSVNNLGHGHPEIIKRIKEQTSKYLHLSNYFASEPTVKLAQLLVEHTFASKVFFANSGTEVNEAALKLARKFGQQQSEEKVEVVTAHNSFHGRTYGGLTLTGQERYQTPFKPILPGIAHFRFNDLVDLESKVGAETCAVFLEMVQGEGGVVPASPEFVAGLVRLSKQYNFLIVVDEIQTGIGRTGQFFAFEEYGLQPHLVTIAKSLGGGLPLGAMLVSQEVEGVLTPGDHGSTFGGNPLSCAVGEVVVSKVLQPDFLREVREKGQFLFDQLSKLQEKFPQVIKEIRGRGLMIGIETGEYASQIKELAMQKQLLINVTSKTVVRLLPALNIKSADLERFLQIFEEILVQIT